MVVLQASRCKFALPIEQGSSNDKPPKTPKTPKARKSVAVKAHGHVDPLDKLSTVDREKLFVIQEYKTAIGEVISNFRDSYIAELASLVIHATNEKFPFHANTCYPVFAVRVPPTISDSALVYSRVFEGICQAHDNEETVSIKIKNLHTETLPVLFAEIARHIGQVYFYK